MRSPLRLLAALLLCAWAQFSQAGTLERLLMPGEVSQAHAKLEQECAKCHDRTDKSRQTALCMDCHKDVAADVRSRQRFHGHVVKPGGTCSACHTEHEGRKADIVRFDRESFDHALTGYPLAGKHSGVTCASCHAPGKKFRQATSGCFDCHQKDDAHKGSLGKDCAQCHSPAGWAQALQKFDHAKTRFPLTGKHKTAACESCHRTNTFKDAPRDCVSCHARDDKHQGTRGPACGECHNTSQWKSSSFDHLKVAHFALLGKHAQVACDGCHRGGDLKAKLPKDCAGCHSADDRHSGRFGADCAACHAETGWKPAKFDHAKQTKWPLNGAHQKVDCHACHKADVKTVGTPKTCSGCHAADDVHHGSMGTACEQCHSEIAWKTVRQFDHDLTKFPLVGLHANVACEECHPTRAFRGTPRECVSCHGKDDAHKGSLGKDCASCHNPNGWKFWQFDHGKATHFALTGAHEKLECRSCHVKPASEVKLGKDCISCHVRDDAHDGRFGRDCARCHTTTTWRGAAPGR
jgi:hypothetical protein